MHHDDLLPLGDGGEITKIQQNPIRTQPRQANFLPHVPAVKPPAREVAQIAEFGGRLRAWRRHQHGAAAQAQVGGLGEQRVQRAYHLLGEALHSGLRLPQEPAVDVKMGPVRGCGSVMVRWSLEFGQGDKLGSPFGEDGPDGGEADAVLG